MKGEEEVFPPEPPIGKASGSSSRNIRYKGTAVRKCPLQTGWGVSLRRSMLRSEP